MPKQGCFKDTTRVPVRDLEGFYNGLGYRAPCTQVVHTVAPKFNIWVVVKTRVPYWVPTIIRHVLFRVPKKGP